MNREVEADRAACLHAVVCMSSCLAKAYDRLTDDAGVIAFWLLEAMERHFSAEEALLRGNSVRLERHRELHREMIRLISRFAQPSASACPASVDVLLAEIREWVQRHGGKIDSAHATESFERSTGAS